MPDKKITRSAFLTMMSGSIVFFSGAFQTLFGFFTGYGSVTKNLNPSPPAAMDWD